MRLVGQSPVLVTDFEVEFQGKSQSETLDFPRTRLCMSVSMILKKRHVLNGTTADVGVVPFQDLDLEYAQRHVLH